MKRRSESRGEHVSMQAQKKRDSRPSLTPHPSQVQDLAFPSLLLCHLLDIPIASAISDQTEHRIYDSEFDACHGRAAEI